MLEVLAVIGAVLGLIAVWLAVATVLSYRQFCRDEDAAFERECAEFWRVNGASAGPPKAGV